MAEFANGCYSVGADGIHKPMSDADCHAAYERVNAEIVHDWVNAIPTLALVVIAVVLGFKVLSREPHP